VTAHPTANWAAAVIRRAWLASAGRARFVLRDRDAIYGGEFRTAIRELALRQVVTAYRTPLQNAYVERLIGTLRRECLDHVIVLGENHARELLAEYVACYNADRTHQALGAESPVPGDEIRAGTEPIRSLPYLGGLHHGYRRAA